MGFDYFERGIQEQKKPNDLEKLILELVADLELCGYDISKELASKGVSVRPNYVYMILRKQLRFRRIAPR